MWEAIIHITDILKVIAIALIEQGHSLTIVGYLYILISHIAFFVILKIYKDQLEFLREKIR